MKNSEPEKSGRQAQASIYAATVYELAKQSFSQHAWAETLKSLTDLVQDDEMRHILRDPKTTPQDMKDLMLPLLRKAEAQAEEVELITTMIDRGDLSLAPLVYRDFVRLQRLDQGYRNVNITSAEPLNDHQILKLEGYLTERFNIRVENIVTTVDKSLLGGVIIRMEDRILDQSQRGQRLRMGK